MFKAKTKTTTTNKKNHKSRMVKLLGDRFVAASVEIEVPNVNRAYYSVDVHGVTKVDASMNKHPGFDCLRLEIESDGLEGRVTTSLRLYGDSLEAIKEALGSVTVTDVS